MKIEDFKKIVRKSDKGGFDLRKFAGVWQNFIEGKRCSFNTSRIKYVFENVGDQVGKLKLYGAQEYLVENCEVEIPRSMGHIVNKLGIDYKKTGVLVRGDKGNVHILPSSAITNDNGDLEEVVIGDKKISLAGSKPLYSFFVSIPDNVVSDLEAGIQKIYKAQNEFVLSIKDRVYNDGRKGSTITNSRLIIPSGLDLSVVTSLERWKSRKKINWDKIVNFEGKRMTLSEGVYRLAINDYNPDTDRIKWKENFPEIVKQKFGISPAISTLRGNIYETLKGKIAKGEFQQIIKKGRKSNVKPISLGAKYGLNKIGKFGGKKMSELDYICVLYEKFGRDWSLIVKKATKVGIVVPSMPKLQQCCYKRLAQISNS